MPKESKPAAQVSDEEVTDALLDPILKEIEAGNILPLTKEMMERVQSLVEGIEVDLDAPIDGDVDL